MANDEHRVDTAHMERLAGRANESVDHLYRARTPADSTAADDLRPGEFSEAHALKARGQQVMQEYREHIEALRAAVEHTEVQLREAAHDFDATERENAARAVGTDRAPSA